MKKIRFGNDIPIEWSINRNDQPEDFTGKTLRLTMIGTSGTAEVTDYTIEGNVLRWMFWGKDQHKPSTYHFCLVENGGEEGMFTIDTCDVLRLVGRSCAADDCDGPFTMQVTSNIDDKGVTCSSVITVPANGLSAYEIAVKHGFEGSEEEWLASLKGTDSKDGKTPILESGTTTTLDAGQSATASLVRDGEDEAGNPVYKASFGIPRGPQGERGEAGKDGIDGSDGADGSNGATFTPSVDSDGNLSWTNDGDLDNPEPVNIKGPKGDKGETGAPGEDGAQGIPGPAGADGAPGLPGTPGADGKTPVLVSGTTTTLDAGQQATSEVVADGQTEDGSPQYKINFGIPKGPAGEAGTGGGAGTYDVYNFKFGVKGSIIGDDAAAMVGNVSDFAQALLGRKEIVNNVTIEGQTLKYTLFPADSYLAQEQGGVVVAMCKITQTLADALTMTGSSYAMFGGFPFLAIDGFVQIQVDAGSEAVTSMLMVKDVVISTDSDIASLTAQSSSSDIKTCLRGLFEFIRRYMQSTEIYPLGFSIILAGTTVGMNVRFQQGTGTANTYKFDAIVNGSVATYTFTQTLAGDASLESSWENAAYTCSVSNKVADTPYYLVNLQGLGSDSSSEEISAAIGGWDNLKAAVQSDKMIGVLMEWDGLHSLTTASAAWGVLSSAAGEIISLQTVFSNMLSFHSITYSDGALSLEVENQEILSGKDYSSLNTESKKIIGAINEVNGKISAPVRLDASSLFAQTASVTSELSEEIAAYGNSDAADFPLLYAGDTIGNICPSWVRTSSGVTNMMCIADNKIWYFEIQGTTVQRAELAIS